MNKDRRIEPLCTIRQARLDDLEPIAQILFDSFNDFNASVSLPPEWPSVDFARAAVRGFIESPDYYAIVALDEDGRVVGSNFLDERDFVAAPGPISVARGSRGHGFALMAAIFARAEEIGKTYVRGVQHASNVRSYQLWMSLGFTPREQLCALTGFVNSDLRVRGAVEIRAMRAEDVEACDAMFQRAHGFSRRNDIRAAVATPGPAAPYVAVSARDGRIVGYTTGFWLLGHVMCESEEVLRDLWIGASHAMRAEEGRVPPPLVHLPARLYPDTLRWALHEASLRVLRLETLITMGPYEDLRSGVYCPGMAY